MDSTRSAREPIKKSSNLLRTRPFKHKKLKQRGALKLHSHNIHYKKWAPECIFWINPLGGAYTFYVIEWKVMLLSSAKKYLFSLLSVLHIFDSFHMASGFTVGFVTVHLWCVRLWHRQRGSWGLAPDEEEDGSRWLKSFSLRHIPVPASCLGVPGGRSHHTRSHRVAETHKHVYSSTEDLSCPLSAVSNGWCQQRQGHPAGSRPGHFISEYFTAVRSFCSLSHHKGTILVFYTDLKPNCTRIMEPYLLRV